MIRRAPRPESRFTQLRNDVLRDTRLSFRARGVLGYILSFPDDWRLTSRDLAAAGVEGRDAVRTALRELQRHGYLVVRRGRDEHGRWTTDNIIYDTPQEGGFASSDDPL